MKVSSPSTSPLVTRRDFLGSAAAITTFSIVPRHTLGGPGHSPPSEKLNIAGIGVGGMGAGNLSRCSDENIVALCDVDWERAASSFRKYPAAKRYKDFRRMLDQQKDIDAVVIATPDHTHAVAGMAAIERGQHVYIQKPLAHSVHEVRRLTDAAREHGVQSQMGNQLHSSESVRLLCEWVWADVIGPIREVHAWSDRPAGGQSYSTFPIMKRPTETPPVPKSLDWDLWLGPAPHRPYHPIYAPVTWRGWWDFGTGALGDMGCHILDSAFWALKLGYPTSVEATTTHYQPEVSRETVPRASIVRYKFPPRGERPGVQLTWYDGHLKPSIPDSLDLAQKLPANGSLLLGEKGVILHPHGRNPIVSESVGSAFEKPPQTLDRIVGGSDAHEKNWITACKSGQQPSSSFDYAGPLSETVLLGVVAQRVPDQPLNWDDNAMKFTNSEEANQYVNPPYRNGWSL